MAEDRARPTFRRRVYEVIEVGRGEGHLSRWVDAVLVTLIIANVLAFVLETVPAIEAAWGFWLHAFELFSVVVFSIEYGLRMWTAVEVPMLSRLSPWHARLKYAMRPALVIDLLSILPFYLGALFGADLRALRAFRLLRFLKLTRYSPAIHTLLVVVNSERRSLGGAFILLLCALLTSATGMYYIEGHAQPEKLGTIPDTLYWAITTLTTVGYGDVVPITPAGKLWAGLTMICGLCVLALPVAILATGFANEVGRHDFVLTWSLVSRIPLFAELDADEVARIMPLLHAKSYPPFIEIIADGEPGEAMYFVASGHVRQNAAGLTRDYRVGDFFGVTAMLEDTTNIGSYRTLSRARLLKLYRQDFVHLELAAPPMVEHIRRVSETRKQHRQSTESRVAPQPGEPEPSPPPPA